MAFWKFCGNEIPEGGVCSCPAAQAEAQGANAAAQVNNFAQDNNVYGQGANNQNGFNPNEMVEKAKKNPAILIGAVAGLIVLIILLCFIIAHTGASGAAKKYAKSITKKGKGKAYYSLTLPDDKIKELKDDEDWKDMIEDYNDDMADDLDDGVKLKLKSVKKGKKLNKKALKGAEKTWESAGADDPEAKKGFEYKIKVQVNDDGDKDTVTRKVCVVKFKGEGWKVIETSAESLEKKGEDKSSSSSYDDFDFDDDDYDLDDFDF